eukprot:536785_1
MSVELYYNNTHDGAKIFKEITNNYTDTDNQPLLYCTNWMILLEHICENTPEKIKRLDKLQIFTKNTMDDENSRVIKHEDLQKWSLQLPGFIEFVEGLGFQKSNIYKNSLVLNINEINVQKIKTAISAINMSMIDVSISNRQLNDYYNNTNNNDISTFINTNNDHQWQCKKCTLLNNIDLTYCEICFSPRNKNHNENNDDVAIEEKYVNIEEPTKVCTKVWNECDRLNSATELYEKRKDLQSLTSLMAMIFDQNVTNFKKQNLKNLFKQDVIKELRILLDTLLTSNGLDKYVKDKTNNIQKTIDLLIEYWTLFTKSKQIIQSKKKHIDVIIDLCFKWQQVLQKRKNLSNGETLDNKDLDFMKNIGKAFTQWFKCESDMKIIGQNWNNLLKQLQCQELYWKKTVSEINALIEKEVANVEAEKQKKKTFWAKCFKRIAKVIGFVSDISAAVIGILFGGGTAESIRRNIFNPAIQYFEAKSQIDPDLLKQIKQLKQLGQDAKMIEETFIEMKKNSGKMDKFFGDFITILRRPMKRMNKIDKKMRNKFNFIVIEINVKHMIKSFEQLQKLCVEILTQIEQKMKHSPNDYTTKR